MRRGEGSQTHQQLHASVSLILNHAWATNHKWLKPDEGTFSADVSRRAALEAEPRWGGDGEGSSSRGQSWSLLQLPSNSFSVKALQQAHPIIERQTSSQSAPRLIDVVLRPDNSQFACFFCFVRDLPTPKQSPQIYSCRVAVVVVLFFAMAFRFS